MYSIDMQAAARRHLEAGEALKSGSARHDVAGYVFGLAAECALKAMMLNSNMRPLPSGSRQDDPFFAHFELLKTLLRNGVSGRLATELRRYAEDVSFMQFWDVTMRYSDGKSIRPAWIDRWHDHAKDIIGAMDT